MKRIEKFKRIGDMVSKCFTLPFQQVMCEHPYVMFNTSALHYMYDGYTINGKVYRFRSNVMDLSFFDPVRRGIVSYDVDKKYIKQNQCKYECSFDPLQNQRYKESWKKDLRKHSETDIHYDKLLSAYCLDDDFNAVPLYLVCPCGRCTCCIYKRVKQWVSRTSLETECQDHLPFFVTLTYDEQHNDGKLHYEHFANFMKKLRHCTEDTVKYVASGEYGKEKNRPHYHVLLFGLESNDKENEQQFIDRVYEFVCRSWCSDLRKDDSPQHKTYLSAKNGDKSYRRYHDQFGHVNVKVVDNKIHCLTKYITKYMLKSDKDDSSMWYSKGLGKDYILRNRRNILQWMQSDILTPYNYCSKFNSTLQPIQFTRTMLDWVCPRFTQLVDVNIRRRLIDFSNTLDDLSRSCTKDELMWLLHCAGEFNKIVKKYRVLGLSSPIKLDTTKYYRDYFGGIPISEDDILYILQTLDFLDKYFDELDVDYINKCNLIRKNYNRKISVLYGKEKKDGGLQSYINHVKKMFADINERAIL